MSVYTAEKGRKNRSKKTLWLWGLVIFAISVSALVFAAGRVVKAPTPSTSVVKKSTPQEPQTAAVTSNAAFFGNAFWGRMFTKWSPASGLGYAYPFSRLSEFKWSEYDATVAGLECPIVAGVHLTPAQQEANLKFNCEPEYLPEAKKWFTAFMLANNHTDNQGAAGFTETQRHLEESGIQYVGHYNVDKLEDICEVMSFQAHITTGGKTTTGDIPVAVCAYHGVAKIPSAEAIALMRQYSDYMPVIAMTHMGTEYVASADPTRTATYRAMIDNGADMVLGDHPHWVQNTEAYKGRLIACSMGNFMFDQQSNREVTRSAGFSVRFEAKDVKADVVAAWLAIGKQCRTYHDDCLARIKAANLTKLPYTYKISAIGVDTSGRITHPASADVLAGILERLQWATTKTQLQAPYSAD